MHPRYPNVFSPIRLGPVELRNRFYSSPHICPLTTTTGGPSEDFIQYYVERVKDGGCGLAILSLAGHERSIFVQPSPYPRANIPAFRTLADAVHEAGGKVFGQIWYWWGTPGHWDPLSPPVPALTPSVLQYSHQEKREASREMTREDIRAMIDAFRQSAENLREAGFDGIMLHAAHGAIIEQFLSPYFNRRTDEYGGSFENRLRFLEEVLTSRARRSTRTWRWASASIATNCCREAWNSPIPTAFSRDWPARVASTMSISISPSSPTSFTSACHPHSSSRRSIVPL